MKSELFYSGDSLADLGDTKGCSTKTVVIHSFIRVILFLGYVYISARPI